MRGRLTLRIPVATELGVDIMFTLAFQTVNDWLTKVDFETLQLERTYLKL
jgi:hypothetical protein